MAILPPARNNFYLEQVDFKSGLSEALFIRLGQQNNFNNQKFFIDKPFHLNGVLTGLDGEEAVDGFQFTPFDMEIFEVFVAQKKIGTGATEIDIKYSDDNGATWTSIFSTRPKIESTATDFVFFKIGDSDPSFTAPVLSSTVTSPIDGKTVKNIPANSALRLDVISAQPNSEGVSVVMDIRPR